MILGLVRFSYLNVFEPKANPSGKLVYSVSSLIPKDNASLVREINEAIEQAIAYGVGINKFSKAQVASLRRPLRDGTQEAEAGNRGPEYKDHFFINASSVTKPGIVGPDGKPIFDPESFYSGCFGYIDVNFFPYNTSGNRGIGVGLNNIMMKKEGPRLDGRQSAEAAFAAYTDPEAQSIPNNGGDLE